MDEINQDEHTNLPFRGMKLEAIKAQIKDMYFNTPAIGNFREIVKTLNLSAATVEHIIKTNQRRSTLKPRHVEIAKELLVEGLSAEKIASILSEIEGFEITQYQIYDNNEICHWKKEHRSQLPHLSELDAQQKITRVEGSEIHLFRKTSGEKEVLCGTLNIQHGKIETSDKAHQKISKDVRKLIIKKIYEFGVKPNKIKDILTQITGIAFDTDQIINLLQFIKRKESLPPPKNIDCSVYVGKDSIIFFKNGEEDSKNQKATEGWEDKTNWIASINIQDGQCTTYLTPHQLHLRDMPHFDHFIRSLYESGLGLSQIKTALNDSGKRCKSTLISSRIQIMSKKGLLKHFPRGYFHSANIKAVKYHIEHDQIIIYKDNRENETGKMTWQDNSNRIASLNLNSGELTKYPDPVTGEEIFTQTKTEDTKKAIPMGKKPRNYFDLYVRYKWHADEELRALNDLAMKLGESSERIKKIVVNNPWGMLKPVHEFLILKMHTARVSTEEMRRALTELEGINLSSSVITRKLEKIKAMQLRKDAPNSEKEFVIVPDLKRIIKISEDELYVCNKETGEIIERISFKDAENAVRAGYGVQSSNAPPLRKQGQAIIGLTVLTNYTLAELTKQAGIKDPHLAKAILLYDLFDGDEAKFDTRFRTSIDLAMINKIVTYTKFSDLSLKEIAVKCGCHPTTAGRYALRKAFFGNKQRYDTRFNPNPTSETQVRQILDLTKDTVHPRSITEIASLCNVPFPIARRIICEQVFHNDETAFAQVYPFLAITPKQVEAVKTAIRTGTDSAVRIAKQCHVAEYSVRHIALVEVYHGDYDLYRARFPESGIDDATRAAAVALILAPMPGALNLHEITIKLETDGHPISLGAVHALSKELITGRKERAQRFPGDQAKGLGHVTHVLCEGICKIALQERGTEWFSEVTWVTPDPGRWRRVRIDGVIRLSQSEMCHLFERVGAEGLPLGEELGLNRRVIEEAEEIGFDFTGSMFDIAAQEKADKYAHSSKKKLHQKRIVFVVNTGQWFWDGRVRPPPGDEENVRIINLDVLADLCQLDVEARRRLEEVTCNYQFGERDAQEALAMQWGLRAQSDTVRYYESQGKAVPDFDRAARGGFQDLREYTNANSRPKRKKTHSREPIEFTRLGTFNPDGIKNIETPPAKKACTDKSEGGRKQESPPPAGKQTSFDSMPLVETQASDRTPHETRKAAEAGKVSEAEKAGNEDQKHTEKGFDPERFAEAQKFARVIREARNAEAVKEKKGIDPTRLAEARKYAKILQTARDADTTWRAKHPDSNAGGDDSHKSTRESPRKMKPPLDSYLTDHLGAF